MHIRQLFRSYPKLLYTSDIHPDNNNVCLVSSFEPTVMTKSSFQFKTKGSKALNAMWTVDVASCNSHAGQQAARQRRAAPPDSFVVHLVRPIWTFVLNDSPR